MSPGKEEPMDFSFDQPQDRKAYRSMASMIDGRDGETDSLAETSEVPAPIYIYYRIFAEDGAIPSRTPAPGDPFLGRIKAKSVPPPHRDTAQAVKLTIAKMENIKDRANTNLFLTPYSQLPMDNAVKLTILNKTGPGSTPQEPLAFVARISDVERSALESGGKALVDAGPEIRYLYYLLYVDGCEMQSKVAVDPEEASLGRIRTDAISPPHSSATIKACISRVEKIPELAYANLFADISSNNPLKESYISILRSDCPGLSPKEPMAIVQMADVQDPSIPYGRYAIKNRAADVYWNVLYGQTPIKKVYFGPIAIEDAKRSHKSEYQWNITHDANGNICISSLYDPSSWVGAEISGSTARVPWRLIRADSNLKFYYLTTDMDRVYRNPRVPAAQREKIGGNARGSMAPLKEGDNWQMWEFIPL